MSKAPQQDQQRLLDVQALDTRIDQAVHRRENLPAAAQLAEMKEQAERAGEASAQVRAELGDVQRELARVEQDVEKAKSRRERDQARLDEGSGQAKDLVALQHEVDVLNRRLTSLEDTELDIMERVEEKQRLVDAAQAVVERLAERMAEVEAGLTSEYAQIDEEIAGLRSERDQTTAGLDAGLMALYERLRASRGGVGAAALRGKRCEGCRLELTPADMEHIRAASPDEVLRCEECGRILVRPEDGAA
ncbi:MAG: C4-type zinc ribbon domain-containing protein [Bifidobacteriaceae bacterium]|nr:C4-type zinc ribbon domain-containing protein [Bifidobacteriaceae bacterium]